MTRPRQTITHLTIDQLMANPGNIRDGLGDLNDMARSIREHGILQPLTVTEHGTGGYVILAGHRRFRAGINVGLQTFPVIIRHGLTDRSEQLVVMLVENTQRRDLDPVEKAKAYKALVDQGLSQTEIARRVGCKPSTVNYYLGFLTLDAETLADVQAGKLRAADARDAAVEARQSIRTSSGREKRGRRPDYFGANHPLFKAVARMCGHDDRQVIGRAGCGQCWESAIIAADQTTRAKDAAAVLATEEKPCGCHPEMPTDRVQGGASPARAAASHHVRRWHREPAVHRQPLR